jgi:metal-responsive CopG/Arc/MetJ family transcriptional regulator
MKNTHSKKIKMKKITLDLPVDVLEALDKCARDDGRDRSKQVRFFLAKLVLPSTTQRNQAAI